MNHLHSRYVYFLANELSRFSRGPHTPALTAPLVSKSRVSVFIDGFIEARYPEFNFRRAGKGTRPLRDILVGRQDR